jgi:hypothetical protein
MRAGFLNIVNIGASDLRLARGMTGSNTDAGADTRQITLDISADLFHLLTESLRLHSNETRQIETLERLVDSRATTNGYRDEHRPDTLRKHLRAMPSRGDIRICINIQKTSADSLDEARECLGQRLGSDLTFADALSVLLFDYLAERKASQFLEKVGLSGAGAAVEPLPDDGKPQGNVVPLR